MAVGIYFLFSALYEFQPFPPKGKGAEGFVVRILFFLLYGLYKFTNI
jgi:hypothetical protein